MARQRFMSVAEIESLEIILAHSDIEFAFNDWIDRGEPEYHFYPHVQRLLRFLKHIKPDTPLEEPIVKSNKPVILATPYDTEELI